MIIDESHNIREEDDAAYESFSERKAHTNIPALKNNKNMGTTVKAFSERILNGSLKLDVADIHGVAN